MARLPCSFHLIAMLLLCLPLAAQQDVELRRFAERVPPDMRPVLDGQLVRVSGVIAMQPVQLARYRLFSLQNDSGHGVALDDSADKSLNLQPGDRVEVEGTVELRAGLPVLRASVIRKRAGGQAPAPQRLSLAEVTRPDSLGRYVEVDGDVLSSGANSGGDVLVVGRDTRSISVFLPRIPRDRTNNMSRFKVGDRVRITGLTSVYAPIPPYDRNYQVIIPDASAVVVRSRAWFMPPATIGLVIAALVCLVLIWWWRERLMGEQRRVLRGIFTLSEVVLGASSAREIAQRVQRDLPRLLPGAQADLMLFRSADDTLSRVVTESTPHALTIPIDAPIGTMPGAIALCLRNRALLRIPDTAKSPILNRGEANPPGSVFLVPAFAQGELMGVLAVNTPRRRARNVDLEVALQHLGNQVAASLHLQERQQMRDQLLRSEKMAATGQLISGLAKDLRAPLDNIGRAARDLVNGKAPGPEIEEIASQAEHGLEMIDHLLSFSRMEHRDAKPLDINALTSSLIDLRREERDRKEIVCENLLPLASVRVVADRVQLEQAMLTVLVHSEQAAVQSPDRTFEASSRVIGRKVLVTFECQRTGNTEPAPSVNLGDYFGFPVAQVIIQSHGGDLRSSRPRGLIRFELELPVYEDTSVEESVPPREGIAVRMLTCLLIEPDTVSQRKIIAMLATRGHRGIPAATAEEAADLVQRMQFDVIFCGSRLSGLTWLELYHRIRRRIGAFALLSDTWDAEAAQTLSQGEGRVLTRPVSDRDLDDFLGFVEVRLAAARG